MSQGNGTKNDVKFSVDILFSEALEFTLTEIAAAVQEDFPECAVTVPDFMLEDSPLPDRPAPNHIKTDGIVLGMLHPVDPANGGAMTMTGLGFPDESFRNADHTNLVARSGHVFGATALHTIKTHQSYVTIVIKTSDTSLKGRFRAARQLTAVSAIFAQLPITLGVLVHWTGHMVKPAQWVEAAHKTQQGEWPLFDWISYHILPTKVTNSKTIHAVGSTQGLSQFLDFEFQLEAAPIQPQEAMQILMGACWLPLEGGSTSYDGDTMGVEASEIKYTRRRHKTSQGEDMPVISLLHPDCPIDEEREFGPNPRTKPPVGFDNRRHYKMGFMQRLLGGKSRNLH